VSGSRSAVKVAANAAAPGASVDTGCAERVFRHQPGGRDEPEQADGHVDQEDRAPPGAGDVRGDEEAPEQLADDDGAAGGRSVQALGASAPPSRQRRVERGYHLRDDQRGAGALEDAESQQQAGGRGEPAAERRGGEPEQAGAEYPASAEPVAEPPAGHQQGGVGRAVAGHDEFQDRRRGV
jgi:hypothetical protein